MRTSVSCPNAHEWHLKDDYIPMEILEELAEMGVFGLTIPEEYGGLGLSKASMVVVSEELSRGYIGVGSLGTRSEIAAELVEAGGTEEQKATLAAETGQRRNPADRRVHRTEHRLGPRQPAHPRREKRRWRLGRSPATRPGSPTRPAPT